MQSDDPAFLVVGTEVSAKFKGAFCEAKVKKIVKLVKCKILLKESPFGSIVVEDYNIRGKLELNQLVEVVQGKNINKGVVQYIKDCSTYTVVFNDGDERVLRRTQLCLKGKKHFDAAVNLDTMPLYHPDSFANSISRDNKKKRKSPILNESDSDESKKNHQTKTLSPTSSRRSVRSVSVTPLKRIASTRSVTRAVAALKHGDFTTSQSKSPTPARSQSQRASSVVISAKRIAALHKSKLKQEVDLKLNLETDFNSQSKDEISATTDKKFTKNENIYLTEKGKNARLHKKGSISSDDLGKKTSNTNFGNKKKVTPSINLFSSTNQKVTNELNDRKKSTSPSKLMSSAKEKLENGNNSLTTNPSKETSDFEPGSVVVINEFVPPKIGGRIQLGLVVSPKEYKSHVLSHKLQQLPNITKRQIAVRIFQNGRYHVAKIDHLSNFNPSEFRKLTDTSTGSLKIAFERANLYYTKKELPQSWEKKLATQSGVPSSTDTVKKEREKDKTKENEKLKLKIEKPTSSKKDDNSSEEKLSESEEDDDYNERRDRFVAHFYKFQDESGNPMNRIPVLGGKEIDLYRFYDLVSRLGGHKRVTLESKWKKVLIKLHLESCPGATPQTVKNAYLRYFEKFEAFMKHLGYSSLIEGPSSYSSRSSRLIRTTYDVDRKKKDEKRKEKRTHEKNEQQLSEKKDRLNSVNEVPVKKPKLDIQINSNTLKNDTVLPSTTSNYLNVPSTSGEKKLSDCKTDDLNFELTNNFETIPTKSVIKLDTEKSLKPNCTKSIVGSVNDLSKKISKHLGVNVQDVKPAKIKKEDKELNKQFSNSKNCVQTINKDENLVKLKNKSKNLLKYGSHESDLPVTSTKDNAKRRLQQKRRRSSTTKEDRVKSPLGHNAIEEKDIGYSNANIFTRFYQGQKVHARHHLRFYDARIVIVKQPSLSEIAKSLVNAFELAKITHASCINLNNLTIKNMGDELKDALKNMINATKCFVHYLGWNSRYDEWLMLHKIRVDEKDDKASKKAVDALIPHELPSQLFTVAMDWCESSKGIPALANTHTYSTDQQRPRRLSSYCLGRGKSSSTSLTENTSTQNLYSNASTLNTNYLHSKYSTHLHNFYHGSTTKPSSNVGVLTINGVLPLSCASNSFSYNSPLNLNMSKTLLHSNSLTVSTSHNEHFKQENASPKSPFQIVHCSPIQSYLKSSQSFDENILKQPLCETSNSSKFTIPHLQYKSTTNSQTIRNSTVENTSNILSAKKPLLQTSIAEMPNSVSQNNLSLSTSSSDNSTLILPSSFVTSASNFNTLNQTFENETSNKVFTTLFSNNNLSNINFQNFYEQPSTSLVTESHNVNKQVFPHNNISFSFSQSSTTQAQTAIIFSSQLHSSISLPQQPSTSLQTYLQQPISSYNTITTNNIILESNQLSLPSSTSFSMQNDSNILQKNLNTTPSNTLNLPTYSLAFTSNQPTQITEQSLNIVPLDKLSNFPSTSTFINTFEKNEIKSSICVNLIFTAKTKVAEVSTVFHCKNNIKCLFLIKDDGKLLEESTKVQNLNNIKQQNNFLMNFNANRLENNDMQDPLLIMGRSSPLTTGSSCGAVEDFDENLSIRFTETSINDDDECGSLTSNETKTLLQKFNLGSPHNLMTLSKPNPTNIQFHTFLSKNCQNSKLPYYNTNLNYKTENRTTTLHETQCYKSKSPEITSEEETYEGQIPQTDSSHAVRMRVLQQMEAEHLFNSYRFLGLPELVLTTSNNCGENIKILEDRMQVLRNIYQTYRTKLTKLDRSHKIAMTKKKNQVKETKEVKDSIQI